MKGPFNINLALDAARHDGRALVEVGSGLLDLILASEDKGLPTVLAEALTRRERAILRAVRAAGATPAEASLVASAWLDAANEAGAERRRRAAR